MHLYKYVYIKGRGGEERERARGRKKLIFYLFIYNAIGNREIITLL